MVYYGAWGPSWLSGAASRGGVGIVTLPRDRFGDLVLEKTSIGGGEYQVPELAASFVTTDVVLKSKAAQSFYVNAEGLGTHASLKVELLDNNLKPIPGFSGADAGIVSQDGFQTPVAFKGKTSVEGPARS